MEQRRPGTNVETDEADLSDELGQRDRINDGGDEADEAEQDTSDVTTIVKPG